MKIVFFGTPEYVVPIAEALYQKYGKGEDGLVAVVTQPPKLADREKYLKRSALDNWAYKRKIPLFFDPLEAPPAAIGVLASYGQIIPNEVLSRFAKGILNIHPSLLPQFRGAAPVPAALTTGTNPTGLTVMKMDAQMDHGPIISQFKEEINPDDTTQTLRDRLFARSAEFLLALLPKYLEGKISLKTQDESQATYTTLLKKAHGFLEPQILDQCLKGKKISRKLTVGFIKDYQIIPTAEVIERFVRALTPWPNVWTKIKIGQRIKRLKIISAHCQDGKLILDRVQLEGKNPVGWDQFTSGYPNYQF